MNRSEFHSNEPLEWNDLWDAAKANLRKGCKAWTQTTEEQAEHMLGCVPPAIQRGQFFACGEPWSHDAQGRPIYACFRHDWNEGRAWMRYATIQDLKAEIGQGI